MTIREYITRRGRFVQGFSLFCAIVALAAVLFMDPYSTKTTGKGWIAAYFALVLAIGWFIGFITKCPRCKRSLGSLVSQVSTGWRVNLPGPCPHCGVSLDEPK
jgi:hypothetical protein